MKYHLATVAALAWTAVAIPSVSRSPALGSSMKPGMTVFSDGKSHSKRAPRMGDSLDPGVTVISHGIAPREQKRAAVDGDCSSSGKQQYVDQSLADCVERARAGQKAAQDTNSDLMRTFFKNDSPDIRAQVAESFGKMAQECQTRFASSNTTVTCAPDAGQCQPGVSAVTTSYGAVDKVDPSLPKPEIRLCDQFFRLNPDSADTGNRGANTGNRGANKAVFGRQSGSQPACGSLDSPGVVLHEMSHAIIGTTDMIKGNGEGSYGLRDVEALSPKQNLNHADTYALFAHAAALGCSEQDLSTGGVPAAGVPPSLYGNDASSTDPDPVSPPQTSGVSGGRGPRRTKTPKKTRTRGPTGATRGPASGVTKVQATPEAQSPGQATSGSAEEDAASQPQTQQPDQADAPSAGPVDQDTESFLEQAMKKLSEVMDNSFN